MTARTIPEMPYVGGLQRISQFFAWMVRPHPRVSSAEAQRQAQFLAILLLVLSLTVVSLLVIVLTLDPNDAGHPAVRTGFGVAGLFATFYLFTRCGYVKHGAIGFIFSTLVLFIILPFVPNSSTTLLPFVIVPVLLAGMFFSVRAAALVALFSVIITYLLNQIIFLGQTSFWAIQTLWYFVVFGSVMILTFMWHLNNLERIRRQELQTVNEKLRESEASLDQRVREVTRDLSVAATVSTQFTSILDLDQLLSQVVEQVRAGFDLYQVSIYLYDETILRLTLAANSGRGGTTLSYRQFGLENVGLVPKCAREQQPVVAGNVLQTSDYFPNPALPETQSELVLPVVLGDKLIGVLDLQSERAHNFSEDDIRAMTPLATQIGIAVRNARLYSDVSHARKMAEDANRIKSQFLANMSHELRTPLNAILNFTAFVADGILGPVNNEQTGMLHQAITSGKHLLALINDILDITKIEAGLMDLFIQEVDMNEVLHAVSALGKGLVKDKAVEFRVEVDPQLPQTFGDKRRLRQVFVNLLSNAVKFTRQGHIILRAYTVNERLRIEVEDTGIGIAPQDYDVIFESFKQAKHDLPDAVGTGLGLPISKYFIETHGGSISFTSALGVGTTFRVELPMLTEDQANGITMNMKDQILTSAGQ
jgi:signal transduction histidine kinase